MNDALGTYLHDHLAGAAFAVELLESLREHHGNDPLGIFATELLVEIEADRSLLQQLAKPMETHTAGVKEAAAWLAEKASRLKLRQSGDSSLGTFETLEALALGILGKESLWNALAIAAVGDPRLQGPNYEALARRAYDQYTRVENRRLEAAQALFALQAGTK
jgi:hypothetical protein